MNKITFFTVFLCFRGDPITVTANPASANSVEVTIDHNADSSVSIGNFKGVLLRVKGGDGSGKFMVGPGHNKVFKTLEAGKCITHMTRTLKQLPVTFTYETQDLQNLPKFEVFLVENLEKFYKAESI